MSTSGLLHDDLLVRDDVVGEVGVHRGAHLGAARLDVGDEAQQRPAVVGLRETLALQQPAPLQLGIGVEEAVGGHQLDVRGVRPAAEQLLEDPRRRRLAHGHRAGHTDDEGHPRRAAPRGTRWWPGADRASPRRRSAAAARAGGRPPRPRRGRPGRRGRAGGRCRRGQAHRMVLAQPGPRAHGRDRRTAEGVGDGPRVGTRGHCVPGRACDVAMRARLPGPDRLPWSPCVESSDTSGRTPTARRSKSSWRGWPASSTAATTPPAWRWSPTAGSSATEKRAGKLENLGAARWKTRPAASTTGIGHTRWATHGGPTDGNAHPHRAARRQARDHPQRDHRELPRAEEGAPRRRASSSAAETDTEVAAHIVAALRRRRGPHRGDAPVVPARGRLHPPRRPRRRPGSSSGPGATRRWSSGSARARTSSARTSPRSSATPARDRARPGPDRHDHPDGHDIIDFDGNPAEGTAYEVTWDAAAAEKGGYDLFMEKEIASSRTPCRHPARAHRRDGRWSSTS
jgi:hypothetical protein